KRSNLHFLPRLRNRVLLSLPRRSSGRRPAPRRLSTSGSAPQSPPFESAVESLPPITGHDANSREDSRPFSSALESFLFKKITLWFFVSAPFCPGSATQT